VSTPLKILRAITYDGPRGRALRSKGPSSYDPVGSRSLVALAESSEPNPALLAPKSEAPRSDVDVRADPTPAPRSQGGPRTSPAPGVTLRVDSVPPPPTAAPPTRPSSHAPAMAAPAPAARTGLAVASMLAGVACVFLAQYLAPRALAWMTGRARGGGAETQTAVATTGAAVDAGAAGATEPTSPIAPAVTATTGPLAPTGGPAAPGPTAASEESEPTAPAPTQTSAASTATPVPPAATTPSGAGARHPGPRRPAGGPKTTTLSPDLRDVTESRK
jgi:hypothetical protein